MLAAGLVVGFLSRGEFHEAYYVDIAAAQKGGAVQRGWIPEWLPKTARALHEALATVTVLMNTICLPEVWTNVTVDWTVRENVRAHLRVLVKRILRKHGYPPDKQEKATQTVLEQAEVLSQGWAAA